MNFTKLEEELGMKVRKVDTRGEKSMKIDGVRIMLTRKQRKLTQYELADKVGVVQPYISRIENGDATNVTVDVVQKIAEALEVSAAYILDLSDDPSPQQGNTITDSSTLELLSVYGEMGNVLRSKLLEIARVLKE